MMNRVDLSLIDKKLDLLHSHTPEQKPFPPHPPAPL
jgi:hypothetical protein